MIQLFKMEKKKVLGVDIGNVIINSRLHDPKTKEVDEEVYASFPPSNGVFDSLQTLSEYFDGEVYLISKCTEWAQEQILLWLKVRDFYTKTGIKENNIYFVRQRHEKDSVCQKLGVTHFIDDRLEVLSYMIESTPNLVLFQPDSGEVKEFEKFLPMVTVAHDWAGVVQQICK
jgi:carboxypeptidase C (cathepsin A)